MGSGRKNRDKMDLKNLKTRPFERNLALTRLGLGAGAKIVGHSLTNIFRGQVERTQANRDFYERQATILADELGRLKGSVMKAGQMLSLYGQYVLPEEAVAVLSELEDDTQPVQWKIIAQELEKSLGRRRLSELDIDEKALAAASLGQVHRARRKSDGRELCIKIQYPGVADAIESDIKTLSRLLLMSRLIPEGLNPQPVFDELRTMLYSEVDYLSERRYTEEFGRRLAADPRYVVPTVVDEYSNERVLTTTYEHGVGFKDATVQSLSQARRDRIGQAMFDLFLQEFFAWGLVQTDPHFGNYKLRLSPDGDDRIVLLDFGATRAYPRTFVQAYGGLVQGAVLHDAAQIRAGAERIGMIKPEFPEPAAAEFAALCQCIVEPFEVAPAGKNASALFNARGEYCWGRSDLPMRVAQLAARSAVSVSFRIPPPEIVFLHRRLSGVFVALGTLRAELDLRQALLASLATLADNPKPPRKRASAAPGDQSKG